MAENEAVKIEREVQQLGSLPEELELEDAPIPMKRYSRESAIRVKPGTRMPETRKSKSTPSK